MHVYTILMLLHVCCLLVSSYVGVLYVRIYYVNVLMLNTCIQPIYICTYTLYIHILCKCTHVEHMYTLYIHMYLYMYVRT